jgi:hypothetical protein
MIKKLPFLQVGYLLLDYYLLPGSLLLGYAAAARKRAAATAEKPATAAAGKRSAAVARRGHVRWQRGHGWGRRQGRWRGHLRRRWRLQKQISVLDYS